MGQREVEVFEDVEAYEVADSKLDVRCERNLHRCPQVRTVQQVQRHFCKSGLSEKAANA